MLAQGGMAEVYRADQELAAGIFRPVALKVIRPEYSESPDFREMFLDEARTASTLSHPNIAHIYDVGDDAGLLFMVMELVPGETLAVVCRALREAGDRLSDEALLAVGIQTCSALEAVHALKLPGEGHLNLVHRDVSPHNLLLSATGSLKLIDFGIAKAATNRNLTMPGITKGKAGYFSPEQAMGRALDGRSDLFSLAVTMYKLAAGGTPFDEHRTHQSRNQALVNGRWDPLEKACPGLPKALYEIVNRALKLRPEERFADAKAMRVALEQAAVGAGLNVGQSSLAGYVDDEGEIGLPDATRLDVREPSPAATLPEVETSGFTPTAPKPVSAPVPPARGRRRTERVVQVAQPPVPTRTRRLLIVTAIVAGSAIAGFGALFAFRPPAPPAPVPPVPVVVVVPKPLPPVVPAPVPVEPPPPRVEPPIPPEVRAPLHRPPKAPVVEERIPKGVGKLRVGAVPDGVVSVGAETWGQAPVDKKMPSGQYRVNVLGANGKKGTCFATVLPDKTTIVIYNFDTNSCR
jgi:serine/threonine protein kinase